ncbi:MAG: hypothetical protein HY822_11535 [Acidobacteria bacterium]|nr:hypothetical protein [Acidobacteriota bacterium]
MRRTVEIGAELYRRVKRHAAIRGTTLRNVVESALAQYLSRCPRRPPCRLRWRTESGRLLPGVRLDNRDALFNLMDSRW